MDFIEIGKYCEVLEAIGHEPFVGIHILGDASGYVSEGDNKGLFDFDNEEDFKKKFLEHILNKA